MNKKVEFHYNEKYGSSYFDIDYNGIHISANARCHPDDMDFSSERTGLTIAEARATVALLKAKRRYEIEPQLKILKHLYGNMTTSKHFNPKSYEAKMIRSQIRAIEKELATISNDIADEEKYLEEYIQKKDAFYKKMRAKNN